MTPEQKGSLSLQVEKLFYDLQDRIFSDIVRRIKKTGKITSTADYQIQKLRILGNSTEFIEQELKKTLDLSYPEIWALYDQVAEWEYVRYKDAYEQINGNFVPLEDNEQIQQWSQAIVSQTNNEIKNLTQSLGMTVDMGRGKKVFTPLAEYYQRYLDRACLDIVTGAFDYNTVLRRVVKEMAASDIRIVDYASGWSNRAPVAARRAIMTGVSQLSAKINEQIARELKTDTYEVTWHAGHRPSHWWGGNVYTYQELKDVCHLGEGDGLCGWNCRHSYLVFIPGYAVRTYAPEQLRELEEKEKRSIQYQGKSYTPYEASQKQRQLETKMREQRANVKYLKEGGAASEDVMAARGKYLNTLHQYQAFSKKMGLPEQMERVYMDGLGRVAPGRSLKNLFSSQKSSGKIKEKLRIPQVPASNISKKVESGEYSLKLSTQQYDKHIFGTKKYVEYRQSREAKGGNPQSHITVSATEVQEIIRKKHGTGIVRVDRAGNPSNVELITCDKVIGQYYAKGEFHDTKKAALHYSKKGTHLVPIRGDNYD